MRSRVFGGTTDVLIFTAMCSMWYFQLRLQSIKIPRFFTYSLHSRLTSLLSSF